MKLLVALLLLAVPASSALGERTQPQVSDEVGRAEFDRAYGQMSDAQREQFCQNAEGEVVDLDGENQVQQETFFNGLESEGMVAAECGQTPKENLTPAQLAAAGVGAGACFATAGAAAGVAGAGVLGGQIAEAFGSTAAGGTEGEQCDPNMKAGLTDEELEANADCATKAVAGLGSSLKGYKELPSTLWGGVKTGAKATWNKLGRWFTGEDNVLSDAVSFGKFAITSGGALWDFMVGNEKGQEYRRKFVQIVTHLAENGPLCYRKGLDAEGNEICEVPGNWACMNEGDRRAAGCSIAAYIGTEVGIEVILGIITGGASVALAAASVTKKVAQAGALGIKAGRLATRSAGAFQDLNRGSRLARAAGAVGRSAPVRAVAAVGSFGVRAGSRVLNLPVIRHVVKMPVKAAFWTLGKIDDYTVGLIVNPALRSITSRVQSRAALKALRVADTTGDLNNAVRGMSRAEKKALRLRVNEVAELSGGAERLARRVAQFPDDSVRRNVSRILRIDSISPERASDIIRVAETADAATAARFTADITRRPDRVVEILSEYRERSPSVALGDLIRKNGGDGYNFEPTLRRFREVLEERITDPAQRTRLAQNIQAIDAGMAVRTGDDIAEGAAFMSFLARYPDDSGEILLAFSHVDPQTATRLRRAIANGDQDESLRLAREINDATGGCFGGPRSAR